MTEYYRKLKVWQQAITLVVQIYELTANLPKSETFGLSAQMRRAAVSIPSNIAEGSARGTDKDRLQFLRIAMGSLRELETQIEICRRLKLLEEEEIHSVDTQTDSVAQLLTKFMQAHQRPPLPPAPST